MRDLAVVVTWLLATLTLVTSCPEKCVCRSSTVDCSNQGLAEFPQNVPRDTVKL